MITPQSRVKLVALVVDHAVVSISDPSERSGRPFDVPQEGLERLSVACGNPAPGMQVKTAVAPASKKLHALGGDRVAFEHAVESPLAEEGLERGEVEILGSGVELRLLVEHAE